MFYLVCSDPKFKIYLVCRALNFCLIRQFVSNQQNVPFCAYGLKQLFFLTLLTFSFKRILKILKVFMAILHYTICKLLQIFINQLSHKNVVKKYFLGINCFITYVTPRGGVEWKMCWVKRMMEI